MSSMFSMGHHKKKKKHKKHDVEDPDGEVGNPLTGSAHAHNKKKGVVPFKTVKVDEEFCEKALGNVPDLDPEKEPNELVIALSHARNLTPTDYDPIFGHRWSDPRIRFVVQGTEAKKEPSVVSETRTDTLNPVYNEVLRIKLRNPGRTPLLSVYVEDYDIGKGADRMGQFSLPMESSWKHKVVKKKWYKLKAPPDMTKGKISGEVLASFLWWYNPQSETYSPFKAELAKHHDPTVIKKRPPNELNVAVFRAKGLAADDKDFLSGAKTSDARVRVVVRKPPGPAYMPLPPEELHPKAHEEDDEEIKGPERTDGNAEIPDDDDDDEKKDEEEDAAPEEEAVQDHDVPFDVYYVTDPVRGTLRPVWKQMVNIQYVKPPIRKVQSPKDFPTVEIIVEDMDLTGEPSFLGKTVVHLGQMADQKVRDMQWYKLEDDPELNTKGINVTGAIELSMHWAYNIHLDPHGQDKHRNETLLSYLTPDFLEDAIEHVVKEGQEMFYDVVNTMILIADVYEISQEWKLCVDAISVVVGLTPTVNDAISEAQDIASIFIKILSAATGNPAAILNLLYTGYKTLNNSKHLFKLYDESGRFIESMLVIEHFVVVVMDVIARGYRFYSMHFHKMEKKERSEAKKHAKQKGIPYGYAPEWCVKKDMYPDETPNTLYVGLIRARDLAVKDKYLIMRGGTSDPRMDFALYYGDGVPPKTFESDVKPRTLKPQWNQDWCFPGIVAPDEKEVLDKFLFGSEHPILEDPEVVKDPDTAEKPIPVVRGKTVPEPSLPDVAEVPELDEKGQPVKSSKSAAEKKKRDKKGRRGKPLFRKTPKDVAARKQMKQWRLYCDLVDVDADGKNDSLGQVSVDLLPLRNHKLNFGWNLLKKPTLHADVPDDPEMEAAKDDAFFWNDDANDDGKISGEVELMVRWVYEPENDTWQPPFQPPDASLSNSFNEVQIGLFRCRELPAMDDNVTTQDSSDPFLEFTVISKQDPSLTWPGSVSSTKYQTLFPIYREAHRVRGGPWTSLDHLYLKVVCRDYDLVSASDHLGSCEIPLADILEAQANGVWRAWHVLTLPEGVIPVNKDDIEKRGSPKAEVELFLQLAFNVEPPKVRSVAVAPDYAQTCFGLLGAPPSAEQDDGLLSLETADDDDSDFSIDDDDDSEYDDDDDDDTSKRPTTQEIVKASKNAKKLKSSLMQDAEKFQDLVEACGSFLRNPEHRRASMAVAETLKSAILGHRNQACLRSFRLQRSNLVRFPSAFFLRGGSMPQRNCRGAPTLSTWWSGRRGFLKNKSIGAPPSADRPSPSQDEIRPTVVKASKTSFKATHEFMGQLESSIGKFVQDMVNVLELYNDLTRMNSMWNDALKALAFVENTIPKIVSSLEVIESIIKLILKAIQGISFPPNPALLVDTLHTFRQIFKQAKSVYETYCCQKQLGKSVGILTLFAKALVDAIARVANMLSGEDGDGICGCC